MSEARIHRLFLNSPRWSIPIPEGPNSVRVTFSQTGLGTLPVGHMYGVANDHTLTGHTNIWVLANLPTLFFPFLVARQLPNPRAGYEEQSRTALDHVANLSPFNRGTTDFLPSCRLKLG